MITPQLITKSIVKWGSYTIFLTIIVVVVTFGISYIMRTYPPTVQAAESEVGQIHLQQESLVNFYEDTFPDGPSMIISSASSAAIISVTVLDNLSLSVTNAQPKLATNWIYGATIFHVNTNSNIINVIIYTVTANY